MTETPDAEESAGPGSPVRRTGPSTDPFEELADLESQAAAWSREERAAEVVDRAVEAYRGVTLASRLVAALGREVTLDLGPAGHVRGALEGAGDGWVVVGGAAGTSSLVLTSAAYAVTGASDGSAAPAAWPLASRRTVPALLQRYVQTGVPLRLTTREGVQRRGRGSRVGADFIELRTEDGAALLVPIDALAVLRTA